MSGASATWTVAVTNTGGAYIYAVGVNGGRSAGLRHSERLRRDGELDGAERDDQLHVLARERERELHEHLHRDGDDRAGRRDHRDGFGVGERAGSIQFRINNTSDPRVLNVMKAVRDNSSWWETRPSPNPKAKSSTGELIGQGSSQMTRASAVWGCAARVSVNPKTGKVRVTDVTTVGDVGILVNPLQQKRMMEGGVVMGVSEALHEQVTFNKGTITSRDWVSFPILRIIDTPKITTVILTNQNASGGSMGTAFGMGGEGPNGYIAAAIANAIFDATGKQPRRLPFTPKYIRTLLSS